MSSALGARYVLLSWLALVHGALPSKLAASKATLDETALNQSDNFTNRMHIREMALYKNKIYS